MYSGQQHNNILCGRELNREGHQTKNLPFSLQGGRSQEHHHHCCSADCQGADCGHRVVYRSEGQSRLD